MGALDDPSTQSDNRLAEAEFWHAYREPGTRYFGFACAFGALTLLAFYLIDAASGNAPCEVEFKTPDGELPAHATTTYALL